MTTRIVAALTSLLISFAAHAASEELNLQPNSAWAVSGSGVGPPCTQPPSPQETDWATVAGDGVTLSVAGTNVNCCDCIRRSALFTIGTTNISGASLAGKFSSTNAGTYADGTFRVILRSGTTVLGHKIYATQQRTNNNCAGSAEEPETVNSSANFDIDLTTLNPNSATTFDTIQIEMLGYACPTSPPPASATSATATLSDVQLTADGLSGTAVTPTTPTDVTSPFGAGGPGPFDAGYTLGATVGADGGSGAASKSGCSVGGTAGASLVSLLLLAGVIARLARRHETRA